MPKYEKTKGTTFVELSIAMAIVAILSIAAVPAFTSMASSNRVSASINEFLGALRLARNEAAMQGQRVVMCKSADGAIYGGQYHFREEPSCRRFKLVSSDFYYDWHSQSFTIITITWGNKLFVIYD